MTIEIGQTEKLFNLAEARALLPLVKSITEAHQIELAPIQARLNKILSNDPRRPAIEIEYEEVVSRWRSKIEQLGPSVRGLWVVEFDVGEGYLSWRWPEVGLNYFRMPNKPLSGRVRLGSYVEETDPDWV